MKLSGKYRGLVFSGLLAIGVLGAGNASQVDADEAGVVKAHAIAMHGDIKYPADFSHFDYVYPDAPKGGELRLGNQGSFDSLNGYISKGRPASRLSLVYDTLTEQSADEPFTEYGLLAQYIETPADRSWVIYHLREEARFHDGQPVTAEDVVYTFNLLIEKGIPLYASYYGDVTEAKALDKHRVKFNFKPGVNRELALILGQLPVLPKHFWQDRDFEQSGLEIPLGSGPYRVAKVDPGRSITYERVADYWGRDLPVNRGRYNFDRVRVDYYKDGVVLLEALKAGEFDVRREMISKQWATGYEGKALSSGKLKKMEVPDGSPAGMQGFLFNLRKPKFQDRRVRKALNYAFDFEWTNSNLFYGAYSRSYSFFSNSELASSGLPSEAELEILAPFKTQLPETVFTTPYKNPVSDGKGRNRQNLRIAKNLLAEAGWVVRDNQLVHAETGEVFTIEFLEYQPTFQRIINPYIQALKRLGINATIRMVEPSQWVSRVTAFDFDIMNRVMAQTESPGNEQREFWSSAAAEIEGSRNFIGIKNPIVDNLIEQLIAASDRQDLIDKTRALDRVLLNEYYVVPQWYNDIHRIAYWDKFGRPAVNPPYDLIFDTTLFTWWVDQDKAEKLGLRR